MGHRPHLLAAKIQGGHLQIATLFFEDLYNCTAGDGNPSYRADLLKQCSMRKTRPSELIPYAELEFSS